MPRPRRNQALFQNFRKIKVDARPGGHEGRKEKKMNLKARRLALGLTQQQLADRAGMVYQQIQKWESGERDIKKMSLESAAALAHALEIPIE